MKNFIKIVIILLLIVLVNILEQNDVKLHKEVQELKQKAESNSQHIKSLETNVVELLKENQRQKKLQWFRKRYVSSKSIPTGYFKARKKQITRGELKEIIYKTLDYLPYASTWENVITLLLETAIVESNRGKFVTNKRSSAVGIWQILPSTAEDCHRFLRYYPSLYKKVMALYDKKQETKWNLIHNMPYAVAIAYTVYWRRVVDLDKKCGTLKERGILWKTYYNTYKDRNGNVELYINKNS